MSGEFLIRPAATRLSWFFLLVFFLAFASPIAAQAPEPGPAQPISIDVDAVAPLGRFVTIRVTTEGTAVTVKVRQILPGEDLDASAGLLAAADGSYGFAWDAGAYVIEASAIAGDKIVSATAYTRIGPEVPDPDPTPPSPGPRWILLVHETGDTTPELSRLIVSLRTGQPASYLAEKKHQLLILDDDHSQLQPWMAAIAAKGVSLPAVVIADPRTAGPAGALFVGSVPESAEKVLELIKRHGG